jgi:hypothetical protein
MSILYSRLYPFRLYFVYGLFDDAVSNLDGMITERQTGTENSKESEVLRRYLPGLFVALTSFTYSQQVLRLFIFTSSHSDTHHTR